MFFVRLRGQAKWVFVFLAFAFVIGFVVFGVGSTGSVGLGELLQQQGGNAGVVSAKEARENIRERPKDPTGYRQLATALQTESTDPDAAIEPLTTYVRLKPSDVEAQRELAGLHLRRADRFRTEAQQAQAEAAFVSPGSEFQLPSTSPLSQALASDPVTQAQTELVNERLNAAFTQMQGSYRKAIQVYKAIAKRLPQDAQVQFELAQAAESAGDTKTALDAYERFVELAPEDPTTPDVKERIKQLEAATPATVSG